MATRGFNPRANGEGTLGTTIKRWATAFINTLTCTTINAITLAAAAVGFTISGGTTSKTLTVEDTSLINQDLTSDAGPSFAHSHTTDALADNSSDTRNATTAFVQRAIDQRTPLFYGVTWNESADTYTRTGATAGQALGVTLADAFLPIQRRMRGCLLSDAGIVNYYLSQADWTKKEDGATASVLTGADGQVMIEIPKFWYRYSYAGTTHTYEISPVPLAGFSVHPSFLSGSTELNYLYVGAYEGVLYDTSGAAYTDGSAGQVKDFTATTGDKLSSVSGKLAVTNGTRAQFRVIAANRGTGWSQLFADALHATNLLYLIEYASFYSQSVLGAGISAVTDWVEYNNYYPIAPSGNGNSIGAVSGNNAGSTSCATEVTKYLKYRGIENPFGHIWKWVDGYNVNNNIPYICNVIANFADDTASNYTNPADVNGVAITMINGDGWQNTLIKSGRGFFPASVGASGSTKITDYYYQGAGWRVALSGGAAYYGADDGFCCLLVDIAAASADSNIGGRLCFRK